MPRREEHIRMLRLFNLSRDREEDFEPTEQEKRHLSECVECQQVLTGFVRQFGKQRPPGESEVS